MKHLNQVHEWSQTFDQHVGHKPELPTREIMSFRIRLIQEELDELKSAFDNRDLIEAVDALADIQFVLDGTVLACGLHHIIEKCHDEVFRSNMSKLDENGNVIRHPETGKVLKGKNFFKPDFSKILHGFSSTNCKNDCQDCQCKQ